MSGTTRDRIIADARSLPDLIAKAKQVDPQLAQQLTEKPLIASKTVWGTALTMGVSWAATRYGLGWDANTCALVSGLLVLGTSAAIRRITAGPIKGLFHTGHSE